MSLTYCRTGGRHFCVYMEFFIILRGGLIMPKTKFQQFIFTLITSGCMIFIMGVYNVAIHTGGLQAATFGHALHSFPLEWLIGFPVHSSSPAKHPNTSHSA